MGDVISTHLDEGKRELITARTGEVIGDFGRLYEQQYAVALFNKVRFDIEGGGGPQPQLLHRKVRPPPTPASPGPQPCCYRTPPLSLSLSLFSCQ